MADDKVRVLARGSAACPDFDAADREPPMRRKLGRAYKEISTGDYGYVPTNVAESVTKRAEIARALADGDLWPADQATADWANSITHAGVKFDPTFGGDAALSAAPPAFVATPTNEIKAVKAGKEGST